jgi:hypothetical protein
MKVYIVYSLPWDDVPRLISVHSTEQSAAKAVEKLDALEKHREHYWDEELVQD